MSIFRENCMHASEWGMTDATADALRDLGQGDMRCALRSVWDYVEPKMGRLAAEQRVHDTIHVLNLIAFAAPIAMSNYADKLDGVSASESMLDLYAFFLQRMKHCGNL